MFSTLSSGRSFGPRTPVRASSGPSHQLLQAIHVLTLDPDLSVCGLDALGQAVEFRTQGLHIGSRTSQHVELVAEAEEESKSSP